MNATRKNRSQKSDVSAEQYVSARLFVYENLKFVGDVQNLAKLTRHVNFARCALDGGQAIQRAAAE